MRDPCSQPGKRMIRVLVADDHPMVREGIVAMLEVESDLEVVADARDGREAVELAMATSPDVVLMDVQMPGLDGIGALKQLRDRLPATKVVMLTTFGHENYVVPSMRAGAQGYLLKDVGREQLADAIRRVAAGESLLSRSPAAEGAGLTITSRELEVLGCMAREMSNREIGAALHVSENTVKTHVSHILVKLGATDRAGAVLRAWRQGLLPDLPGGTLYANHPDEGLRGRPASSKIGPL
ncbi:MAG TPA: response regulator transcription factor [Candidatus Acidoferrales bacterium]|nr:response regulator transcription factor [Candidatus Acidoferrales bacterium]